MINYDGTLLDYQLADSLNKIVKAEAYLQTKEFCLRFFQSEQCMFLISAQFETKPLAI